MNRDNLKKYKTLAIMNLLGATAGLSGMIMLSANHAPQILVLVMVVFLAFNLVFFFRGVTDYLEELHGLKDGPAANRPSEESQRQEISS